MINSPRTITRPLSAVLPAALLLFSSCVSGSAPAPVHSPDARPGIGPFPAVFSGTLPCADCEGIETTITLFEEGDVRLHQLYSGTGSEPFTEMSSWEWDADASLVTVRREGDLPLLFTVDEGGLSLPEGSGRQRLERVPGSSARAVIAMLDRGRWILTEAGGEAPQTGADGEFVYIRFVQSGGPQEGRFEGFSGCNRFFGAFSAGPDYGLKITELGSTKMFCADSAGTEMRLFEALNTVESFSFDQDRLLLFDATGKAAARFAPENR